MSNKGLERKVVWLAALIQLANVLDFMIILPLGPDLTNAINIASSDMGYLGGAYTFSAAICGILFAPYLDRFDRKKAALFFLSGLAVSTILCGFAYDTNSMLGARLLAGFFAGPVTALSMSMVIDSVPLERRARAIAIVGSAFTIASIFGIPLALELSRWFDWKMPFFAIGAFAAVVLVLVIILLPAMNSHIDQSDKKRKIPLLPLLKRNDVLISYVMSGLLSFAQFMLFAGTINYFVFNLGFPRDGLAMIYAVGGVLSFACMMTTGRIVDRYGARLISWIVTVLYVSVLADGYLHIPIIGVPAVFCLFMVGAAVMNVITASIASEVPGERERAAFMSLQTTTKHIAAGAGSLMSSIVLTTNVDGSLNHIDWLAIITIACIISIPLLITMLRNALNSRVTIS